MSSTLKTTLNSNQSKHDLMSQACADFLEDLLRQSYEEEVFNLISTETNQYLKNNKKISCNLKGTKYFNLIDLPLI
jgi:hypothetical protein